MTSKDIFESVFPQDKQIGGSHYKNFQYSLTNLFQRMIFHSFKVMLLNMFVDIYTKIR